MKALKETISVGRLPDVLAGGDHVDWNFSGNEITLHMNMLTGEWSGTYVENPDDDAGDWIDVPMPGDMLASVIHIERPVVVGTGGAYLATDVWPAPAATGSPTT